MPSSPASWIESQQPAMLELLKDLVSIDSHSYYKEGVSQVFRRLQMFFESFGLKTESHFVEGVEAALSVTVNAVGSGERPVLLMGHCDTVFPSGEVEKRPFRIEGNRAYGPGVADMKAGVVMNAFIIASLAQTKQTFPEVTALFTCDEEIGSPLSRSVIESFAKKSAFVFNSEPGRPSGNVVTGRKGGIFLEMGVQGKAAHSGGNFSEGINAISEIANKIVELDKLTDIDQGLTVSVGLISGVHIIHVDATEQFMGKLGEVSDPEAKRKIIGREFVEVFQVEAGKLKKAKWLAQGTIYPDVIESAGAKTGKAVAIKSHHNVGGLPDTLNLKLLEPLRELFKDEVRKLGVALGLPHGMVYRHPFPGPGLGVRILGAVNTEFANLLRRADAIFIEELHNTIDPETQKSWYDLTSQAFAVFLPVKSVGVMGDGRTYDYVVALRAVQTSDFMTADWAPLPYPLLAKVSSRIINEVRGINRVVYDVSSKPPATIEWE